MRTSTFIIVMALLLLAKPSPGQTIKINNGLRFPKNNADSTALLNSLTGLLDNVDADNEKNAWIWGNEKASTFVLIDEFKGIKASQQYKNQNFYQPQLINLIPVDDSEWILQLSYIGTTADTTILRACFELVAHKDGERYVFSSSLLPKTRYWRTYTYQEFTFHYQGDIDLGRPKEYIERVVAYDKKLGNIPQYTDIYLCKNLPELEQLVGVLYKLDYNGSATGSWMSSFQDKQLLLLTSSEGKPFDFDEHDLWHSRARLMANAADINKPVDEGCAYLYGGSWGLSWGYYFLRI